MPDQGSSNQNDASAHTELQHGSRTSALVGIKRLITEEELDSAGAKRLLLNHLDVTVAEVEKLNADNTMLRQRLDITLEDKHAAELELATLRERLNGLLSSSWLENIVLAVGGILIGGGISFYFAHQDWAARVCMVCGCVLFGGIGISRLMSNRVRKV